MTDPDPRIEAVARVVAIPVHAFTDRPPADGVPWGCDGCRELAAEVLAAADAVDPLRQPSRLDRIEAMYADPEGWPDADD